MATKYVMKKANGNLFPVSSHGSLVSEKPEAYCFYWERDNREEPDFDPYTGLPKAEKTATNDSKEPDSGNDERFAAIVEAVAAIDPATYGKPSGGRPAMPKIAQVVALTKFKVSADEIVAAMDFIKVGKE